LINICDENQYQKTVISLQGKTRKKVKIRTSGTSALSPLLHDSHGPTTPTVPPHHRREFTHLSTLASEYVQAQFLFPFISDPHLIQPLSAKQQKINLPLPSVCIAL
jgi:hypothetical protein